MEAQVYKILDDQSMIQIQAIGEFGENLFGEKSSMSHIINMLRDYPDYSVEVLLSSLGGLLSDALTGGEFIRNHSGDSCVKLYGQNASSATVFSCFFDKVLMSEHASFLIHNVWGSVSGDYEEMKRIAEDFEKHNEIVVNLYHQRSGQTKKKIRSLMKEAQWLSAEEAYNLGFVDGVFGGEDFELVHNHEENIYYNKIQESMKKNSLLLDELNNSHSDRRSEQIGDSHKIENAVKTREALALLSERVEALSSDLEALRVRKPFNFGGEDISMGDSSRSVWEALMEKNASDLNI